MSLFLQCSVNNPVGPYVTSHCQIIKITYCRIIIIIERWRPVHNHNRFLTRWVKIHQMQFIDGIGIMVSWYQHHWHDHGHHNWCYDCHVQEILPTPSFMRRQAIKDGSSRGTELIKCSLLLADVFYFPHHYCQHQHQCYHRQFYNDYFYFTTFDVARDILLIVNITLLVP